MTISAFIAAQPPERQAVLTKLHNIITANDKTVTATIAPMMGKEMIIYNAPGSFKYGLASVKKYMSLHVLPMYMSAPLHTKYQPLLSKASFQKGCINFNTEEEMPVAVVKALIKDCAKIDLAAIRANYLKSKKAK